jgi:hypothetical protein
MDDPVNNPPHYNTGDMECIEAQVAALTYEEMQGYLKATAIKYLWRMGKKGPALTDAKKAQWFIDRLVVLLGTRVPTAPAEVVGSVDEEIKSDTKEWLEECNIIGELELETIGKREAMLGDMVQTAAAFDPGDAPDPVWDEDHVREMDKIRGKIPWHPTRRETPIDV